MWNPPSRHLRGNLPKTDTRTQPRLLISSRGFFCVLNMHGVLAVYPEMKKLISCVALLAVALAVFAGTKTIPPCPWAGNYIGVVNPTSYPSAKVAPAGYVANRSFGTFEVGTNYSFTYSEFTFSGDFVGSITGTMTTAGVFRATNSFGGVATGKFGAKGTVNYSYIAYPGWPNKKAVEKGTYNGYRENVLP